MIDLPPGVVIYLGSAHGPGGLKARLGCPVWLQALTQAASAPLITVRSPG